MLTTGLLSHLKKEEAMYFQIMLVVTGGSGIKHSSFSWSDYCSILNN